MRTNIKMLLIVLFFSVISVSCRQNPDLHYYISIVNNSSKDIFFTDGLNYPDTLLNPYNITKDAKHFRAKSNSTAKFYSYPDSWERTIGSNREEGVMIFLFDAEILDAVTWDSVLVNYLILNRYSLSLKDLDSLNWTIIYPTE